MKPDELQKWALGAEIVGGIAVVATLGLVAFELNQSTAQAQLNTNALEIASYQSLISSIVDFNAQISTSPDLARIELAALNDINSITPEEKHRLRAFYRGIIRHGDMAYFHYQRGAFDTTRLNSVLSPVRITISRNPIALELWEEVKYAFVQPYVLHLDDLISSTSD